MKKTLKEVCKDAMAVGRQFDLSDCHYGETTGSVSSVNRPTNYYYFLAGLVSIEGFTQVLEVGTHCGGSILSIAKGINKRLEAFATLTTIDITYKNGEGFRNYPHITRVQGDSLDQGIIEKASQTFSPPIDLLYIDSLHEYDHTRKNIDIYGKTLNPKYIILDDIHQCESMERLWKDLMVEFEEIVLDLTDIVGRKGAGFGIIDWRKRQ